MTQTDFGLDRRACSDRRPKRASSRDRSPRHGRSCSTPPQTEDLASLADHLESAVKSLDEQATKSD